MPGFVLALSAACVVAAVLVGFWFAPRVRRARLARMLSTALYRGDPRRSRALARIAARGANAERRAFFAMQEANALLWEGEFERAIAMLRSRVIPAGNRRLGIAPILAELEALLWDERVEEAKALFAIHEQALASSPGSQSEVSALRAIIRFFDGDLGNARTELEGVVADLVELRHNPILRATHFMLAAIAHRQGRRDDLRAHLAKTIHEGGDLFIVRWGMTQWEALLPGLAAPPWKHPGRSSRGRSGSLAATLGALRLAPDILLLRTASLARRRFTIDTILALAVVNGGLVVGLRFVDFSFGSLFLGSEPVILLIAPILFTFPLAHLATAHARARDVTLRLLGGFYAALPVLLVAAFWNIRLRRNHPTASLAFEIALGLFTLLLFVRLSRAVAGPSMPRLIAASFLFSAAFLLPMHLVGSTPLFIPAFDRRFHEQRAAPEMRDDLMFAQLARLLEIETQLEPERPGIVDLWFVGAAGWSDQSVFLHEMESARELFDQRFDTRGHSLVLANDASTVDEHPLASRPSLRHLLKTLGSRMNPEEDILFLALTSHGSTDGLVFRFPPRSPFDDEVLRPAELGVMLDDAKIKWRVLLIIGCYSGVYVDPLQSDHTLIATAAAKDRVSRGCADGRPFTDFGRAVFAEQLARQQSFAIAFANAAQDVGQRERQTGITASLPQIAEGRAIRAKLAELEHRLFAAAKAPKTRKPD